MARASEQMPLKIRLAELVAALSLGIDLGFGQPMEHVLRQCLIAMRLAERVGLDDDDRAVVYYTALLVNVGCHSDAHEQAKWFGDDIAMKSSKYDYDLHSVRGAVAQLRRLGAGNPPLHRFRIGLEFALGGYKDVETMIAGHAAAAQGLAEQIGLPPAVQAAVGRSYEQWDGRGWPDGISGDEIPIASRLAQLAEYVEVAHRVGGVDGAKAFVDKRAGSQFDPALCSTLAVEADEIFGGLDAPTTWDEVISSEPALGVLLSPDDFEVALQAIADFVDLKSPCMLGHARSVAQLVEGAATHLGLGPEEVRMLRRAALVQGFGRLGVSNAIWDKPGPLGEGEWERVRLQPYLTQRMLRSSAGLAPLGAIAVQARERLDGSGYPSGLSGVAISRATRILGAADAYAAMCEPRPHRPALEPSAAAREIQAEVKAGRLDRDAVDAVLAVAGHRSTGRSEGPAGLTSREIEVLRLLARGLTAKDVSARLSISPKTVRNHVEHIYSKIGASNRVTASLFAVQHGLVPEAHEPD